MKTTAARLRFIKVMSVVAGIGAGAFHHAHADSFSASLGKSIPPADMGCFNVVWGAVTNNGRCGSAAKSWEMQVPVRASGWHRIDLFTSFSTFANCSAFTTNQFSVPRLGTQISVTPEGGSFRRRFENLPISTGSTMSVQCLVPVGGFIKTVSAYGL